MGQNLNRSRKGRMVTGTRYLLAAFFTFIMVVASYSEPLNIFTRRCVKIGVNPSKESLIDSAIVLAKRSAKAGYNMAMLECSRFPILDKVGDTQLNRIKRACSEIKKAGLHLMPSSLHQTEPVHTSLKNAEALPVRNSKFVVSGNVARMVEDPAYSFVNAGFESWQDKLPDMPQNWSLRQLTPGKTLFCDKTVIRPGSDGNTSIRIEIPKTSDPCIIQNIKLKPWRAYRISLWVKTKKVEKARGIGCEVYSGGRAFMCIRGTRGVRENQDWKEHSWDFCSLDGTLHKVRVTCAWAWPTTGTVWFDDLRIEEIGLAKIQTRSTTPVTVKSESGTVYKAGKDYVVGKEQLTIPAGSAIKNGDALRVDWYRIADMEAIPATASFCHPETWNVLRRNVKAVFDLVGPIYGWHVRLSEWRVAYWDQECQRQYPNAATYMGSTARKAVELLREFNPTIETQVWNANFDPYHIAKEKYYMVNGSAVGTWNHLDPKTIIGNWNGKYREKSLRFYAGKDPKHQTIPRRQVFSVVHGQVQPWLDLLDKLEKEYGNEVKGLAVGVEYGTWAVYGNNYNGVELMANLSEKAGRWGTNPCPFENGCEMGAIDAKRLATSATQKLALQAKTCGKGMAIEYTVPMGGRVRLSVVDPMGKEIKKLIHDSQSAGAHVVRWNAKIPAGVYFVRVALEGTRGANLVKRIVKL